MSVGTQVGEGYGFGAVDDVLADPFPPGIDPVTVRLPSVPKVRSAEDDQAHHRAYWQAHVWAALHVYRRAFGDPACPPSLQGDYPRVEGDARSLVDRATGSYPISPMDSVACHAALKDLLVGARALEGTVAALRGAPDVPPADLPTALPPMDGSGADGSGVDGSGTDGSEMDGSTGATGDAPADGDDLAEAPVPTGVHGPDFFAPVGPSRAFEFKLSLRGARGLKRGRALGGGSPTEDRPPA